MRKLLFRLLALCVGLTLLLVLLFLFKPRWLIGAFTGEDSHVTYWVETDEAMVALTIDDGPDLKTTGRLLEILEQNDARVTFFVLSSNVPVNEQLIEQIVGGGA